MNSKMCDCNQGRLPCSCKPVAHDNSEARFAFFGCVYRNAQTSPAEIGRFFARKVNDQKELTTEVVRLMESAFTVALAESQDLRIQLAELEAEKYALEDQVRGLQELMKAGEHVEAHLEKQIDIERIGRQSAEARRWSEGAMCRGAWELGTACGRCNRCDETDPAKGWIMTLATGGERPFTYWFGRLDRKDDMRPTKIEAADGTTAWRELRKQLAILAVADGKARDV